MSAFYLGETLHAKTTADLTARSKKFLRCSGLLSMSNSVSPLMIIALSYLYRLSSSNSDFTLSRYSASDACLSGVMNAQCILKSKRPAATPTLVAV